MLPNPFHKKHTFIEEYTLHRWTNEKINFKPGQDLFRKSDGGLSLHPAVWTNNGIDNKEKIYYELYNSNNTYIQSGSVTPLFFHLGFIIDSYLPVGKYRIRLTYMEMKKRFTPLL